MNCCKSQLLKCNRFNIPLKVKFLFVSKTMIYQYKMLFFYTAHYRNFFPLLCPWREFFFFLFSLYKFVFFPTYCKAKVSNMLFKKLLEINQIVYDGISDYNYRLYTLIGLKGCLYGSRAIARLARQTGKRDLAVF